MAWTREQMAQQAAKELKDGYYINLGIGIPTLVSNFLPDGVHVTLEGENGILGLGPFPLESEVDPDLINASKQTSTVLPHGSFFDSATSFAMIRGGHIDVAMLGAMQVSEKGDIANWTVPGKIIKGMGGAMDLVAGVKRLIVLMEHNAPDGSPKVMKKCSLPLTGQGQVNEVITDLGIFKCDEYEGMTLIAMAPGVTVDEIKARTDANFKVDLGHH